MKDGILLLMVRVTTCCEDIGICVEYPPGRPNTQDIIWLWTQLSQRVGPDPYHPHSPDLDINNPYTWCVDTWDDERSWKQPYLGMVLLLNMIVCAGPR